MVLRMEKICPVLETAIQICSDAAEQKNIDITMDCDSSFMAEINSSMLEQAIINLLTNAISYSPENSTVIISVDQLQHSIRISLQDQGMGINPEQQQRVFERFYRCDKARSRKNGGTGLGLAIVKHIVDSHNGNVEFVSQAGNGSTFSITLPAVSIKQGPTGGSDR